jgi:hypothetical protein
MHLTNKKKKRKKKKGNFIFEVPIESFLETTFAQLSIGKLLQFVLVDYRERDGTFATFHDINCLVFFVARVVNNTINEEQCR